MHWPSLRETTGRVVETEWDELFDRFSEPREFRGTDEQPGWSATICDPPQRELEHVRRVTALVLDYDHGETIDAAVALWGESYGFIHTTRKHKPDAQRFRVILPFARPVSVFEYESIWRRANVKTGGKTDQATKDAGRFWFTPGGEHFETRRLNGTPLDPDQILRTWPEPVALIAPVLPLRRERTAPEHSREARAIAYIAKMPGAIQGSDGSGATWAVARKLAQDFELDEETTFRILWTEYNPRCEPPWSQREMKHKAHDACKRAKVRNPVGDRHWEPPPHTNYGEDPQASEDPPQREPGDDTDEIVLIDPEAQDAATDKRDAATRHGVRSLKQLLEGVVARADTKIQERGATTGNYELDQVLGGLRRKKITILGADTSFGKSSFAIMVADEVMKGGANVLFLSCEDGEEMYAQRFMARRAGVNAFRIRDNDLRDQDVSRMRMQAIAAQDAPFFLDVIGKPVEQAVRAVTDLCKEIDFALVIVDYVQRFTAARRTQDKRTEVTYVAGLFSDAIKNGNAAGLILSQLRRPENMTKPPTMHDLKESGDLENMAEHVLLGHLEVNGEGEQRREQRHFYIAKNKDGPRNIDRVTIPFDTTTASFTTTKGQVFRPPERDDTDNAGFQTSF